MNKNPFKKAANFQSKLSIISFTQGRVQSFNMYDYSVLGNYGWKRERHKDIIQKSESDTMALNFEIGKRDTKISFRKVSRTQKKHDHRCAMFSLLPSTL